MIGSHMTYRKGSSLKEGCGFVSKELRRERAEKEPSSPLLRYGSVGARRTRTKEKGVSHELLEKGTCLFGIREGRSDGD